MELELELELETLEWQAAKAIYICTHAEKKCLHFRLLDIDINEII